MTGKTQKILFVSHKANRGGAPVVLLGIIKEFRRQSSLPVKILLMDDGPLVEEFRKLAPTWVWTPRRIRIPGLSYQNLFVVFLSRLTTIWNGLWILFSIRKTTLVFSNTIANGHIHLKLLFLKAKFITYVHELGITIRAVTNEKTLQTVLQKSDYFLACSLEVKNNLVNALGVAPERIEVLYSTIPDDYRNKKDFLDKVSAYKKAEGIPEGSLVIGAVGENEWRKGFDLFAPLIRLYFHLYPASNAHFVWMGIKKERPSYLDDMHDFAKSGIVERTHFIFHSGDFLQNMAAFDLHLLLSREDPFPLVVLETGRMGIPTICFQDSGGAPEFIGQDAGLCVPYGDLYAMAAAINSMETDVDRRNCFGQKAREKMQSGYNQAAAAERIIRLMEEIG